VPDWRGFEYLRLSAAVGGFAAPAFSAADCPTACQDHISFQADAASKIGEVGPRATGNYSSGIPLREFRPPSLARLCGGEPAHACSPERGREQSTRQSAGRRVALATPRQAWIPLKPLSALPPGRPGRLWPAHGSGNPPSTETT